MKIDSKKRSIIKALTWRLISTSATFIIVYAFTNSLAMSYGVCIADIIVKVILYYYHERVWIKYNWLSDKESSFEPENSNSELEKESI